MLSHLPTLLLLLANANLQDQSLVRLLIVPDPWRDAEIYYGHLPFSDEILAISLFLYIESEAALLGSSTPYTRVLELTSILYSISRAVHIAGHASWTCL
ncbi:uncharacterized protein BDW70DRAFT_74818 [Aspergillus foveolatus]|uniref:uncharacterized protein n=1 Tax=Aspergillus foveolatus TaxID=210207 RepID=UPI003CCD12CF